MPIPGAAVIATTAVESLMVRRAESDGLMPAAPVHPCGVDHRGQVRRRAGRRL